MNFIEGDKVYWNNPDLNNGYISGYYKILAVIKADDIFLISHDDEKIFVFKSELS